MEQFHGTTILTVRRGTTVAMAGDGQVSLGDTVMKGNARKVRRLHKGQILAGFAGGTADAFTLFERFEGQLDSHGGQLVRAAVAMAREWRSDRALRRLEALLTVAIETPPSSLVAMATYWSPRTGPWPLAPAATMPFRRLGPSSPTATSTQRPSPGRR